MSALGPPILHSVLGHVDRLISLVDGICEMTASRDIADDMDMVRTSLFALRTKIRARIGDSPVRDRTKRNVRSREDRPDGLEDATGDVSSSFQDVDLGDVNDGRAA